MKRRFDINTPMSGRSTPPERHLFTFPPRRPALSDQLTPKPSKQAPENGNPSLDALFASGVQLRLDDEIPMAELNNFAGHLLGCLCESAKPATLADNGLTPIHSITKELPSFVSLKIEHEKVLKKKSKQMAFTKKLIKASEPLLNHELIPESEKTGLLEISAMTVEKMMQLKMREINLAARLQFLEQAIPQHMHNFGKEMGYSDELCGEISRLTKTVLSSY
mgnify:CR=1 FL=1